MMMKIRRRSLLTLVPAATLAGAVLIEAVDGQLGGLTISTLVAWGAHDPLIPLIPRALGQRHAVEIPGARLVLVPDSGHLPMIDTAAAFLPAPGDS